MASKYRDVRPSSNAFVIIKSAALLRACWRLGDDFGMMASVEDAGGDTVNAASNADSPPLDAIAAPSLLAVDGLRRRDSRIAMLIY